MCIIILNRTIQTPIEETKVNTKVSCCRLFPFQVWIRQFLARQISHLKNISKLISFIISQSQSSIIADTVLITYNTITYTQFQVINPRHISYETLLIDTPGKSCRRESSPFIFFSETAGTVTADSHVQQITI